MITPPSRSFTRVERGIEVEPNLLIYFALILLAHVGAEFVIFILKLDFADKPPGSVAVTFIV